LSGAARKVLVPALLLTLLMGCVRKQPGVGQPRLIVPETAFSAVVRCTAAFGKTNVTASGGCAVDPVFGARIELRDPLGAARLLLLVKPREATLISIESGLFFTWSDASRNMPWSASDLWAVLSGRLPGNAHRIKLSRDGAVLSARWRNADGRIHATFRASHEGPCPFSEARLSGPHSASLSISLSRARTNEFRRSIFAPPADLEKKPALPADILQDLLQ